MWRCQRHVEGDLSARGQTYEGRLALAQLIEQLKQVTVIRIGVRRMIRRALPPEVVSQHSGLLLQPNRLVLPHPSIEVRTMNQHDERTVLADEIVGKAPC